LACFQIFSGSISQRILAQARTYWGIISCKTGPVA
jgi:hypothetical protein